MKQSVSQGFYLNGRFIELGADMEVKLRVQMENRNRIERDEDGRFISKLDRCV